jgi:hypothetical protein
MATTHPPPQASVIRQAIGILRKLIREKPDDPSTPFRRGMLEALTWERGENPRMHRIMGESIKKHSEPAGGRYAAWAKIAAAGLAEAQS